MCLVGSPSLVHIEQSETYLTTDVYLTVDAGVASYTPARFHTFMQIDHEIYSTVILLLPIIHSRRAVVSYNVSMRTMYWLTACSSLPR